MVPLVELMAEHASATHASEMTPQAQMSRQWSRQSSGVRRQPSEARQKGAWERGTPKLQSGSRTETDPGTVSTTASLSPEDMMPRVVSEIRSQIIEVPTIEEVLKYVSKREFVEVEKRVPKVEFKYVERVVEVPQIRIVDQEEEVIEYREVPKYVSVVDVVRVPQEVVRYVPKIETRTVEKVVEVHNQVIEVKRPYVVDREEPYPVYKDREVSCVVAQKLIPVVSESPDEFLDVEVTKYVPEVIPVDVYVPRPIQVPLVPYKKTNDSHRPVEVPVPQFNTLLINLNAHMNHNSRLINDLPFQKSSDGSVPLLVPDQYNSVVTPLVN